MIFTILGKPGTGKSYTLTKIARDEILKGRDVFVNYKINQDVWELKPKLNIRALFFNIYLRLFNFINVLLGTGKKKPLLSKYKPLGTLYYWIELEQFKLIEDAVIIMDEAQTYFNARRWKDMTIEDEIKFQQHRHQGLDIYAGVQNILSIDTAIRRLTAYAFELKRFGHTFMSKRYFPEEIDSPMRKSDYTKFYRLDLTIARSYDTMELINKNTWLDEQKQRKDKNFKKMSDFIKE